MMESYSWFVFLAWFVGGFINGVSGMGGVLVAVPLLVLRLPLLDAVVISGVAATIMSLAQGWLYRKGARLSMLPPMLIGCVPGGIAGIFILKTIPEALLQLGIGMGLVAYSLWLMLHREGPGHGDNALLGALAGFASGAAGSSTGFCGPPAGLYAIYAGWDKRAVLGSLSIYSVGTGLVTNILHGLAGFYTGALLFTAIYAVGGALTGLLVSIPVSKKISAHVFRSILLFIIAIAGCVCIFKAI